MVVKYYLSINKVLKGVVMKWIYLVIAGVFEVGWAVGLRYSQGFSKLLPSILTVIGMIASFYFLSLSLKSLPLGTAYAVWTGIGTVGTVIFGVVLFKEQINIMSVIFIGFIISGIIGLKLTSIH
jgi:quaternary ammonium compound-resistance protein SugE